MFFDEHIYEEEVDLQLCSIYGSRALRDRWACGFRSSCSACSNRVNTFDKQHAGLPRLFLYFYSFIFFFPLAFPISWLSRSEFLVKLSVENMRKRQGPLSTMDDCTSEPYPKLHCCAARVNLISLVLFKSLNATGMMLQL